MIKKSQIFSQGIRKIPNLAIFLSDCELLPTRCFFKKTDQIIGWGLRPTTKKARAYAQKHHLPYVALEDGFLRSVGLGVQGSPMLSLVYDDVGIYYDTTRPSKLENLILQTALDDELTQQAEQAMSLIVQYRLSKYNHSPDFIPPEKIKSIVLVVDQTFGDMAVKYGQADECAFRQMLQTAIAENPLAEIWVKTHPDVLCGKKRGYFSADFLAKLSQPNVRIFAEDVNPISLLQVVDKVYCVTSQMGFEALLVGKSVVTFGVPWYAGWGLTDDRHPNIDSIKQSNRRQSRTLQQLFTAAYLQYCRYLNPFTQQLGTIFDVIDYLHQQKRYSQLLQGNIYCVGLSWWKRAVLRPFFDFPQCQLHYVSLKQLKERLQKSPNFEGKLEGKLLLWGQGKPEYLALAEQYALPVLRMEDGFIRSVGLGSNLVSPLSLVVDDLGIYFNPKQPSRLECILQNHSFSQQELDAADKLRAALIQANIGKYNVGESGFRLDSQGKKSLLVVGQVEDDASIRLGAVDICTNLNLLKKVRSENPTDFILYKPHPDVVSGNRIGHIPPDVALQFADEIVENVDILDCISQVDEVHTMTSLAGFEALLRHKTVHCYGVPFYAGWGLTQDRHSCPRRTRCLTLAELVAGVLLEYPMYIDPAKGHFIQAQQAMNILVQQRLIRKNNGFHRSWLAKQWGKLVQLYRVIR